MAETFRSTCTGRFQRRNSDP